MKTKHPIRTLTGLKQEDIAMLLGISRARWGMFEIGKRDLPLPAKQLLTEMLAAVQPNAKAKRKPTQTEATPQQLQRLLRENEYRQTLLQRKIAAAQKKQAAQSGLLRLVEFLESRQSKSRTGNDHLYHNLKNKAGLADTDNDAQLLSDAKIKLELLANEKALLESKLKK